MSLTNPFYLTKSIFSKKFEKILGPAYDQFVEEFYCRWLYDMQIGEFETTIVYPMILDNLKTEKYNNILKNISNSDKLLIYQYFIKMIIDENNHTNLVDNLLSDIYNTKISAETTARIVQDAQTLVDSTNLVSLLIKYYVGECYLWTGFYLFYKQTNNAEIKKIFHTLVVDESHHNNNIYKFFKLIRNDIKFNNDEFISKVHNFKHLGFSFVTEKCKLPNTNTKKDRWWNELIYNHHWHHNFNKIFLKKCFQLYELFNPEVTFEDFFALMNKNELDWLPFKS